MPSLVNDIIKQIPTQFDSQVVADLVGYMEKASEDSEFSEDPGSARRFADLVGNLARGFSIQMKSQPELSKRLRALEIKLRWLSPRSLDTDWRKVLLGTNLVSSMRQGIDAVTAIKNWLDSHEFGVGVDIQRRTDAMYLLANNQELLGSVKMTMTSGEEATPAVKNWIKNYISSIKENSALSGNFDKINFLTKNQDVQKLTVQDKEVLSKVIDLYRLLKNAELTNPVEVASLTTKTTSLSPVAPAPVVAPKVAPTIQATPKPAPVAPKLPVVPVPLSGMKPMDRVAAKPQDMGFKSEFEQKLAAAGTVHGGSLSELKARIEQNVKKGDIDQSKPSVEVPPSRVTLGSVNMTPQEITREVETPELPATPEEKALPAHFESVVKPLPPKVTFTVPKAPVVPKAPESPKQPIARPSITLAEIKVVDDLKKIEVANLRDGDLAGRIKEIKSKIVGLAVSNNLLPFYTVLAFEQSPLFRAYMQHGSNKVGGGTDAGGLTQEEFEALADLRKEVERL